MLSSFRATEAANPERLQGVFGNAPWTDKGQMPDATLKNLIEYFSKHDLTLAAVPEDELGNGYEYLIKKFADDSGHTAQEFYTNRTLQGYEGLNQAQDCLPTNDIRDAFAGDFSVLSRLWEVLSPDSVLTPHEKDYRWLAQVYQFVKPATATGRLLWHGLGAKTIELIHQNVHVDAIRDDLETLVVDAELLELTLGTKKPDHKWTAINQIVGCVRVDSPFIC